MAGKPAAGRATTAAGKKKATAAVTSPTQPAAVEGKLTAPAAAAKVLAEAGTAMTCKELVGAMAAKWYWASPGGKTPAATLYAAITTEIKTKGDAARFRKAAPGRFAAASGAGGLPPGTTRRKTAWRKAAAGANARTAPPAA